MDINLELRLMDEKDDSVDLCFAHAVKRALNGSIIKTVVDDFSDTFLVCVDCKNLKTREECIAEYRGYRIIKITKLGINISYRADRNAGGLQAINNEYLDVEKLKAEIDSIFASMSNIKGINGFHKIK